MQALKIIGSIALAIAVVVAILAWKTVHDARSECESDKRLAEQVLNTITLSNTEFDGHTLLTRIHNNSPHDIHGDFVFGVSLQDCTQSGCTDIGEGVYYVRGGRRDVIPAGAAQDVTARPILDSGIPNVRAQGQLRYVHYLLGLGVGTMGTVNCN